MQLTPEQRKTLIKRHTALFVLLLANNMLICLVILSDVLPDVHTEILGAVSLCAALLACAMRRPWQVVSIAFVGVLVAWVLLQMIDAATGDAGSESAALLTRIVSYVVIVVCPAVFGGLSGYFLRRIGEQMVRDYHSSTRASE